MASPGRAVPPGLPLLRLAVVPGLLKEALEEVPDAESVIVFVMGTYVTGYTLLFGLALLAILSSAGQFRR